MRTLIISILVFLSCLRIAAAQPSIKFDKKKQKFGFVQHGELVVLKYTFTNIGNEPLIINNIEVECTCTTAEKPENPILPGQTGVITVEFNTKYAFDRQDRTAIVNSNDPKSPTKLRFKGVVFRKK